MEQQHTASPMAAYYSEIEAAAVLGRTRRSLSAWRQARKGPPFVKLGPSIYYSREGLAAWLRSLEVAPSSQRPAPPKRGKARQPA